MQTSLPLRISPFEPLPAPEISEASVKAALDGLIFQNSEKTTSALEWLGIVDAFIAQEALPTLSNKRLYALQTILTNLILQQYLGQRERLGLLLPALDQISRQALLQIIAKDAAQPNMTLKVWSVLVARYVLTSLEITLSELENCFGVSDRQLRRMMHQGIEQVIRLITDLELRHHHSTHKFRLKSQIPATRSVMLGQDDLLQAAWNLYSQHKPFRLLLSGDSGMGKSHVAAKISEALIEHPTPPDQIIWIQRPQYLAQTLNIILESLYGEYPPQDWMTYAAMQNILLVIDDGDALMAGYPQLLATVKAFHLIFTTTLAPPVDALVTFDLHVTLKPLVAHHAYQLYTLIAPPDEALLSQVVLMHETAGIPSKICLAALQPLNSEGSSGDLPAMYGNTLHLLTACALLPEGLPISQLLIELTHLPMVGFNRSGDLLKCRSEVEMRIRQTWEDEAAPTSLHNFLKGFISQPIFRRELSGKILLALLNQYVGKIPLELLRELVEKYWRDIAESEALYQWRDLLPSIAARHPLPYIKFAQGIIEQRIGNYIEATDHLARCCEQAGEVGNFSLQQEAMFEIAISLRYQGKYTQAAQFLDRLVTYAITPNLSRQVVLERVHTLIEKQELTTAYDTISPLLQEHPIGLETQLIWAELTLQRGDPQQCIRLCHELLNDMQSVAFHPAIYSLLGRAWVGMGANAQANEYFSLAVHHAHTNPTLMGRALSNMGANWLYQGEPHRARSLLESALRYQQSFNDPLGRVATEHNLRIANLLAQG